MATGVVLEAVAPVVSVIFLPLEHAIVASGAITTTKI